MIFRFFTVSFLSVFSHIVAMAQNNASPYSIIGIGDLEKSNFDRTTGMGNAGIALSSNRFMYQSNPASYVALDKQFIFFDISSRYQSVNYSGTPITDPLQASASDWQFKKIAFAVRARENWAFCLGLKPYSTVNYSFTGTKSVMGTNYSTSANYTGSGSTNLVYMANSFRIGKNLRLGIELSNLFGQIKETETMSPSSTDSTLETTRNIFISKPLFKVGFQYNLTWNKQFQIGIGATATNKASIRANYELKVTDGNTVLIDKTYSKENYFNLPTTYAAGLAAIWNSAYTFAVDYQYQSWSKSNTKGLNYSLTDSRNVSVGFEYSDKVKYYNLSYERLFFQTGAYYSDSYLKLSGLQLKDYGLTVGLGGQLKRSGLGLYGSLAYGITGTTEKNLIKEKYLQFNFTLSYRDLWFVKRKYD